MSTQDPSTENRRPLTSRNTRWAHAISQRLASTHITPNQISATSMVVAALAGLAFWLSASVAGALHVALLLSAIVCVQLRLLCNLFDGMLAIESGKQTENGAYWNEFPDRIADVLILVGVGLGAGEPALGWAAASFALMTAYVRELGLANGQAANFAGPMAKQHRMAVVSLGTLVAIVESLLPAGGWPLSLSALTLSLWLVAVGAALTALRRLLHLL